MAKTCLNCGSENADDSKYCMNCGNELTHVNTPANGKNTGDSSGGSMAGGISGV